LVKLERLTDSEDKGQTLAQLLDWLGLAYELDDTLLAQLQRPHNVITPERYELTGQQETVFWELCGETMEQFGYATTT
jgi:hypothetical protein